MAEACLERFRLRRELGVEKGEGKGSADRVRVCVGDCSVYKKWREKKIEIRKKEKKKKSQKFVAT